MNGDCLKFKACLIGGIVVLVLGFLGLLCPVLLSNPFINATLLIAVGLIGILRFLISNDRVFWISAVSIVILLILLWIVIFTFSASTMTTECVVEVVS